MLFRSKDIEGILDNIEIILTGIRSNKEDWMEMLKPSYIKQLKKGEDPEAKLLHLREVKSKNKDINQPELKGLSQMYSRLADKNAVPDE